MAVDKKRKTYCIMCGKEKDGIEIKIDNVINSIRFIKKKLFHSEKNNRLVVCKECYPLYTKNRKRYISRQRLYITLGVLFIIFSLILAPTIATFLLSLAILIILYLISLLNYTPDLSISVDNKNKLAFFMNKKDNKTSQSSKKSRKG